MRSIGSCLYEKDSNDKIVDLQDQIIKNRNVGIIIFLGTLIQIISRAKKCLERHY